MPEPAMVAMRKIWEASPRARPASIARVPRLCGRIWRPCPAAVGAEKPDRTKMDRAARCHIAARCCPWPAVR
jgi:hypothetical protein